MRAASSDCSNGRCSHLWQAHVEERQGKALILEVLYIIELGHKGELKGTNKEADCQSETASSAAQVRMAMAGSLQLCFVIAFGQPCLFMLTEFTEACMYLAFV